MTGDLRGAKKGVFQNLESENYLEAWQKARFVIAVAYFKQEKSIITPLLYT